MKKVCLCIFMLLVLSSCAKSPEPVDLSIEAQDYIFKQEFMIIGKMDVYYPDNYVYRGKPQKLTSQDELTDLFKDSDMLEAMISIYDEDFFKSNVLVVYGIQNPAASYTLQKSTVSSHTLTISLAKSPDTAEDKSSSLLCIAFKSGIMSAISDVKITVN